MCETENMLILSAKGPVKTPYFQCVCVCVCVGGGCLILGQELKSHMLLV